jgi:hypothetical protein
MKISIIINAERKSKLPHEIRKNLSVIYRHFTGTALNGISSRSQSDKLYNSYSYFRFR